MYELLVLPDKRNGKRGRDRDGYHENPPFPEKVTPSCQSH